MRKAAKDLQFGDVIPAPAGERKWLKTPLTVLGVSPGLVDARGPWVRVNAMFHSPYSDAQHISPMCCLMRPDTSVRVLTRA